MQSLLLESLISDDECIEVLAFVAYAEGRCEGLIYNERLYMHIMFARQFFYNNLHYILEITQTKNAWKENPALMDDFLKRYDLPKVKKI